MHKDIEFYIFGVLRVNFSNLVKKAEPRRDCDNCDFN